MTASPTWLVFGASGAIGRFLLARLRAGGAAIDAVSRQPQVNAVGLTWHQSDLARFRVDARHDVVASAGPLDAFVDWLERNTIGATRVVAIASTSVHTKQNSPDAGERALAARLADCEARLARHCEAHAIAWTVLRPTLIYGGAADRNLSRIAGLGRRLGFVPLPSTAQGRRQPVHADDVATALIDAAPADAARNRAYDLPGGETLPYAELVRRVLGALPERPGILMVPWPSAAQIARWARLASPQLDGFAAKVERFEADLVFDAAPAGRDFGYQPRAFHPTADMFAR